MSPTEAHDEFLELCALSTSGELSQAEQNKLDQHLAICPSCRQALQQYESVIDQAIPMMAAHEDLESQSPGPGWSQNEAERRFLGRLADEKEREAEGKGNRNHDGVKLSPFSGRSPSLPSDSAWNHMWAVYAAGILLFVALSLFAYRVGLHRGSDMAVIVPPPPAAHPAVQDESALEAQLSDASHARQMARTQLNMRDKTIADLRRQLVEQADEIKEMKLAQERLGAKVGTDGANQAELLERQAELTKKLENSEATSQTLQAKLDSLAQQSTQDAARAKAEDAKVNELTQLLQQRETELEQQDQLLAHDRDIRELMGARDLYISEVYDVGDTGETKKPYGRIFYTHGKSLIFYAYDLDQQAELKQASTFQAWGRRGPDAKQSLKLGIFYEDNASRKRWVMKCDDPRMLAQIDAVFVTIEPNTGSRRPSNKTLLFAYLKVNPNHP